MGEAERHLLGALCGLVERLEHNLSEIRHTRGHIDDIHALYTDMKRVQALLLEVEQVGCCCWIESSLNAHWVSEYF